MEAAFLVLIGGALFAQSWNHLGLFSEGRSMGVVVAGLGLLSLVGLVMTPMLLEGRSTEADVLTNITMMKALILVWAVYAVAVAAQAYLDLEERAVGFYAGFLCVFNVFALIYFAAEMSSGYGDGPWLTMSAATLILAINAGLIFFHQAIPFQAIRLVTGWFLLIGGAAVAVLGSLVATSVIQI